MDSLLSTRLLRLSDILGNKKATPPSPALLPICKSTWWAGVKSGRYPQPVKLGPNITAWRCEDIRRLIESGADGNASISLSATGVQPRLCQATDAASMPLQTLK